MERAIALTGGRTTTGVVRIGNTVHRPISARAPELGDFSDSQLVAAACLLRQLHDETLDCPLRKTHEIVCHGDASPCNCVFVDGMPTAFIDFDNAQRARDSTTLDTPPGYGLTWEMRISQSIARGNAWPTSSARMAWKQTRPFLRSSPRSWRLPRERTRPVFAAGPTAVVDGSRATVTSSQPLSPARADSANQPTCEDAGRCTRASPPSDEAESILTAWSMADRSM